MAQCLFEGARDAKLVCDPMGTVVRSNRVANTLFSSPESGLSSAPLEEVFGASAGLWHSAVQACLSLPETGGYAVQIPYRTRMLQFDFTRLSEHYVLATVTEKAHAHQDGTVGHAGASSGVDSELIIKALQYQQMYLAEERLAHTDPLTGLSNRRAFEISLAERIKNFGSQDDEFSLAILDVDFFKKVNDVHGHQVGDDVLQGLAKVLGQKVRALDSVHRIGGEEFAMLLSCSPKENALEVAERIRATVERTPVGGLSVTVSIGVATCDRAGWDESSLVRAADDALYASKQGGRNRVTHADQLPTTQGLAS